MTEHGGGGAGPGEVWVFIESASGRPAEVSLELLGRARELADTLGAKVGAVLPGREVHPLALQVIAHGADRVYLAEHESLAEYLTLPFTRVLVHLIRREQPQIVLYGATITGRDLAPRVASALRTGLTADCTDLQIGDHQTRDSDYRSLLYQIRPAFGGNIIATIVTPERRPQMATVREGVFRLFDPQSSRRGEVVRVPVSRSSASATPDRAGIPGGAVILEDADFAVELLSRIRVERKVDLKGARVIVSGGAGAGSPTGFRLIEELARTLGGVVGASRAAVDAGWAGREHQVGQTGTTVRPRLYIAAGISGSVQHCAGMDQSTRILAINTDAAAPIFSLAHYGIVGDLHDVIPKLIKAYRSKA